MDTFETKRAELVRDKLKTLSMLVDGPLATMETKLRAVRHAHLRNLPADELGRCNAELFEACLAAERLVARITVRERP